MDDAAIRAVHSQLGFPGLRKTIDGVFREAARLGHPRPNRQNIARIVRQSGERQVLKQPRSGQAASYSLSRDSYWQGDVISYEVYQNVAGNNGFKFILAVVDVFTVFDARKHEAKIRDPGGV